MTLFTTSTTATVFDANIFQRASPKCPSKPTPRMPALHWLWLVLPALVLPLAPAWSLHLGSASCQAGVQARAGRWLGSFGGGADLCRFRGPLSGIERILCYCWIWGGSCLCFGFRMFLFRCSAHGGTCNLERQDRLNHTTLSDSCSFLDSRHSMSW